MHYLSQLLDWARGALRAPRMPGRQAAPQRPPVAPQAPRNRPSPDVRGARLVERAEWFPPRPWEDTGAMVRPYVAHLGEAPRSARAGAQVHPWGAAR